MFKLNEKAPFGPMGGTYESCLNFVRVSVDWPQHKELHERLREPLWATVAHRHGVAFALQETIAQLKGVK